MQRQRTGGMTAIAVLNIIFGVLEILNGLFQLAGVLVLIYELLRVDVFEIPTARLMFSFLVLTTGIVGIIAISPLYENDRSGAFSSLPLDRPWRL